jgi:cytochrome c
MRSGTILAVTALAALTVACSKPSGGGGGGGQPAAPLSDADKQKLLTTLPAPYNTADLANGESKFALCQSCHTLTPGGANMTGPNLYGVIGTKAGEGHDDFKFSDALKASGIVWTPDKLDPWIKKPQDMVPGTKMTFAGLDDAKDRTDVIAYLMVSTGYKPK